MSVLIKGMDMPKENEWITISIYGDGTVVKKIGYFRGMSDVFANSAVEVPTPHGDLIDKEEHKRFLENKIGRCLELQDHIAWLNEQPIIIESEE